MTCRHATPTDRIAFDDLTPDRRTTTHFACNCGWNECRCPQRVPPAVRPFDSAGIHSYTRFFPGGGEKQDYIIVRRKYCAPGACTHYQESEERNGHTEETEAGRLRDLQE